ncbi:antigen 5/SCP domain-containing protein, putative, partial [Ixodes scapularis]
GLRRPVPCPVPAWTARLAALTWLSALAAIAGETRPATPPQSYEDCSPLYRRYSRHHTQCLPPGKDRSCRPLQVGVSDAERELILDIHNQYRNRLASGDEMAHGLPAAADMMQLEWNEELATIAQKHASRCAIKTDCSDCRRVESFSVGQNICNYKIRSRTTPSVYWRSTIAFWYEGIKQFHPRSIDPYVYKPLYGTFTQIAWSRTWAVGCGYSLFTRDRWFIQSYVCNYGPS